MKTNRDLFIEKLSKSDTTQIARIINGEGKCTRCSNHYWDWNQNKCHKNINDSNCEQGQAEYLDSYPGENLQKKYHKKYFNCKNSQHAELLQKIEGILFASGVMVAEKEKLEEEDLFCRFCMKQCPTADCEKMAQIINTIHRHDSDYSGLPLQEYLKQVLIPKAPEKERAEMEELMDEIERGFTTWF